MFLALSITCQAWATSQEESSTPGNGLLLVVVEMVVEEGVVGEVGRVREDDINLLQSELGFFLRFLFLFL